MKQSIINFHHTDCIQFMKDKPDGFWDLAVVDPPYGIGAENHAGNSENGWTQWEKKDWDRQIPTQEYFNELFRVSKNQIVWGGNYMTNYLPPSMGWIVWDKGQRDFSLADAELAWTSFNKATRLFTYARAKALKDGKIHPTQKPVDLYRWTLQKFATKGMKIIDTHGGSFSSAIACDMEGYDIDICEIDTDYFNAGVNRFKEYRRHPVMFPVAATQINTQTTWI